MKILDVGIGRLPWIFRDPKKGERIQMGIPPDITEDMTYVGVDILTDQLSACRKEWREEIQSSRGKFMLLKSNAARLPFADGQFDVAILSDVLSHPSHNWCGCEVGCRCRCVQCDCRGRAPAPGSSSSCCGVIFEGIQGETKKKMIQEALRVVRSNGKLVIANYQTTEHAMPYLRELEYFALDGLLSCVEKRDDYYFACPPAECPISYTAEAVYQVSLSGKEVQAHEHAA